MPPPRRGWAGVGLGCRSPLTTPQLETKRVGLGRGRSEERTLPANQLLLPPLLLLRLLLRPLLLLLLRPLLLLLLHK